MFSMFGILTLFSALVATSYALVCIECISSTATCTGDKVNCTESFQCGSVYVETTIDGKNTKNLVRTCVPAKECNFNGSISMHNGNIKMVTTCCATDNCDPAAPALPVTDTKENGLVCHSCLSSSSSSCDKTDTVKCKGNEERCLLQSSTTTINGTKVSSAFKGCATRNLCEFSSQSLKVGETQITTTFTCTNGGLSIHKVVLTPAIVCLLLLKIFF